MSEYKKVGKYSIIKKLGEGVYGKVYLAQEAPRKSSSENLTVPQPSNNHKVALKWTLKDDSPTRAELKVMTRVPPHPNVVRMHENFTTPQAACLVYEFCEGGDLNGYIQKRGEVASEVAADWACDLAAGVEAIHRAGFIHCDLKSDNILLQYSNRQQRHLLKLIDFGLARQLRSDRKDSIRLVPEVETGPYYSSAPEIFNGGPVTDKADVFALGLIFLSFFHPIVVDDGTFRLAAPYVTEERFWGKALREVPQSVINRIVSAHVPEPFLKVVSAMLQLDAAKRPSMTEVVKQLGKVRDKVQHIRSDSPLFKGVKEMSDRHAHCERHSVANLVKQSSGLLAAVGVA